MICLSLVGMIFFHREIYTIGTQQTAELENVATSEVSLYTAKNEQLVAS